jgi:hypothetical protein
MNSQTPSQACCRQQPELSWPAGWFASSLCPRMKSPWLAATLPWHWDGETGMAGEPGGQDISDVHWRHESPCCGVVV